MRYLIGVTAVGLIASALMFGVPELAYGTAQVTEEQQTGDDGDAVVSTDPSASDTPGEVSRQGLIVAFSAAPRLTFLDEPRSIYAGDLANIAFRITDESSGEPVVGLNPGAWIDLAKASEGEERGAFSCKERVSLYLGGSTGIRPMIDLNSYYILAMNRDSTITVIDPNILIAGIGDMFLTRIDLRRPGGDWAQTKDQKRLFVSMPLANALAVVDTESFKVIENVDTGSQPLRVAIQGDGKYVWVGNDANGQAEGGVTVIDAETLRVAAEIKTGRGHHEIAFDDDDRIALVTNRKDGNVSVIDIQSLRKLKNIKIGAQPIAVAYSSLSKAFYVADGENGEISVIDKEGEGVTARVSLKPGLGPMRLTQDGRWLFVTNSAADLVHVIDTAGNTLAHDISVKGKPYQVSMTRAFAYVRALESERISMVNLAELNRGKVPPVVLIPIGAEPPIRAKDLSIADSVAEAAGEAGMVAVSPADDNLYFYMEGMNAPLGNFHSYGHSPRAVAVTDRSLVENDPGIYSSRVQIPRPGKYDVAFILDSPPILHCFSFTALPNPALERASKPLAIEYLIKDRTVNAGSNAVIKFRLTDPISKEVQEGIEDVRILFYRAPGHGRTEVSAQEVEPGIYQASMPIDKPGAYYFYVGVNSRNMPYGDLNYFTLRALKTDAAEGQTGG